MKQENDLGLTIKDIAQRIYLLRKQKKWSQAELAQKAGMSRNAINLIEAEQVMPSLAGIYKIASVFECSVYELLPPSPITEDAPKIKGAVTSASAEEELGRIVKEIHTQN